MCRPGRVGIDREESELHISHGMGAAGVKRHMLGLLRHRVQRARARCRCAGVGRKGMASIGPCAALTRS